MKPFENVRGRSLWNSWSRGIQRLARTRRKRARVVFLYRRDLYLYILYVSTNARRVRELRVTQVCLSLRPTHLEFETFRDAP